MPVIENDTYQPPLLLKSGHLQTIYPSLFRKINDVVYNRERIETPDGDFLDLDWSRKGYPKVAIVSHGLEGNSRRGYVLGMVKALNREGWDTVAWNFRSCSGEPNRLLRSYHSGASEDLETVIEHVRASWKYERIDLIGFSMGGNITLKYLGERGEKVPHEIGRAVAFSVPCDLTTSAYKLEKLQNKIYMKRFLRMLREKIEEKATRFPGKISVDNFSEIKGFRQFDDRYTAPLNGFKNAADYWQQCSSLFYLEGIRKPALLVNALNDPFLTKECFPVKLARRHAFLFLEMPRHGGHVGFVQFNGGNVYWSEQRAIRFLEQY